MQTAKSIPEEVSEEDLACSSNSASDILDNDSQLSLPKFDDPPDISSKESPPVRTPPKAKFFSTQNVTVHDVTDYKSQLLRPKAIETVKPKRKITANFGPNDTKNKFASDQNVTANFEVDSDAYNSSEEAETVLDLNEIIKLKIKKKSSFSS